MSSDETKPYHGAFSPEPEAAPLHSDDKPWSRWIAESNPLVLACLGKLGEETGELSGIIGRIVCSGIQSCAPTRAQDPRYNGETNTSMLEDEIADVAAWSIYTIDRLGLDKRKIIERRDRKLKKAGWWLGAPGT